MLDLALGSNIFVEDPVEEALQEIDILFGTDNCELLGDVRFGMNFEQYLWQLNPSPNALKKYIEEAIANETIYPNLYDIIVNVNVLEGEYRNIYQVIIILRTNESSQNAAGFRIYQLR